MYDSRYFSGMISMITRIFRGYIGGALPPEPPRSFLSELILTLINSASSRNVVPCKDWVQLLHANATAAERACHQHLGSQPRIHATCTVWLSSRAGDWRVNGNDHGIADGERWQTWHRDLAEG